MPINSFLESKALQGLSALATAFAAGFAAWAAYSNWKTLRILSSNAEAETRTKRPLLELAIFQSSKHELVLGFRNKRGHEYSHIKLWAIIFRDPIDLVGKPTFVERTAESGIGEITQASFSLGRTNRFGRFYAMIISNGTDISGLSSGNVIQYFKITSYLDSNSSSEQSQDAYAIVQPTQPEETNMLQVITEPGFIKLLRGEAIPLFKAHDLLPPLLVQNSQTQKWLLRILVSLLLVLLAILCLTFFSA